MEITQITRKHRISLFNTFAKTFGELEAELINREEAVVEERKKLEATVLEHNVEPGETERELDQHEKPPCVHHAVIIELEEKVAALIKENENLRSRNSELETKETLKQDRTLRSRSVSGANKENIENTHCGAKGAQQHTIGPTVGIQTEFDAVVDASPQYEELAKKYEQMRQQVKHYRDAHTILAEKYRRNKAVWKQWVEQDKLRRQKSERLKAQLNASRGVTTALATPAKTGSGGLLAEACVILKTRPPITSSPAPLTPPIIAEKQWESSQPIIPKTPNKLENPSEEPVQEARIVEQGKPGSEVVAHYDSDHTTDGEGELRAAAFSPTSRAIFYDEEYNATPRLPKPPVRVKTERSTQSAKDLPVYIIKSEPLSSNSVLDHIAFTQQSLDLDDIGRKPETPRKRRYMGNYQVLDTRAMQNDVTPTSLRRRLAVASQHREEQLQDRDDKSGEEGGPHSVSTLPAPRLFEARIAGIEEDSQPSDIPLPASDPAKHQTTLSRYFEKDSAHSEAPLKQIPREDATPYSLPTINQQKQVPLAPAKESSKPVTKAQTSEARCGRKARGPKMVDIGIEFMTEDGTNGVDALESIPMDNAPLRKEILGHLLDTPPVKVPSIAHLRRGTGSKGVTPVRSIVGEKEYGESKYRTPVMQNHPAKRNISGTDPPVSKKAKFDTGSERKPDRDETLEPQRVGLRVRKAKDLHISDFVINRDKTRGFNYAYQEVIRKRDERKCLPGCLGSCCKELRDFFAKAGMPPQLPSKAPKWRSSPLIPGSSQIEPDEEGFEEDGEELDYVDPGQLRRFVNKFAKHRNMFDRNQSPPGFWASEFPDTQEAEERKRKAREEERKRVAEMKREAEKGGGRWGFRDEV